MPREIVVERGFPFIGVFSLIRGLIRWTGNLLAFLLIVIGAVLILRQRRHPLEKQPPETAVPHCSGTPAKMSTRLIRQRQ